MKSVQQMLIQYRVKHGALTKKEFVSEWWLNDD